MSAPTHPVKKIQNVLIFGDALMDILPDGSRKLGGCGLNVAWHLKGLGMDPILITRIGTDEIGEEVNKRLRAWGLRTDGIQSDPVNPTGVVNVFIANDGTISFQSKAIAAADFIDESALQFGSSNDLLYYGTYAVRAPTSRQTLMKLKAAGMTTFVDPNLRKPYWTEEELKEVISGASFLKMNEEEWTLIRGEHKSMQDFGSALGIGEVLLTQGSKGASVLNVKTSENISFASQLDGVFRDAVGAGDAFSAAYIFSIYQGYPRKKALEFACRFATATCTFAGAICEDREFYKLPPLSTDD